MRFLGWPWQFGKKNNDSSSGNDLEETLSQASLSENGYEGGSSDKGDLGNVEQQVLSDVGAIPVDDVSGDSLVNIGDNDDWNIGVQSEYPSLDEKLTALYQSLIKSYGRRLDERLKETLDDYIDDKSLESRAIKKSAILQQRVDLSDEQFDCLVEVILFEREYNRLSLELNDLLMQLSEDDSNFKILEDEIDFFNQQQEDLKGQISEFFGEYEKIPLRHSYNGSVEESFTSLEYPELINASNFILYTSNVEERRKAMVGDESTHGKNVMKGICNKIAALYQVNYQALIGDFHRINKNRNDYYFTRYNIVYRRYGDNINKIGFVVVPVSNHNLARLKKVYNNDKVGFLILIIDFGNFKIERISEDELYENFKRDSQRLTSEIESTIEVFKVPFTPESFEVAKSMIERGVDITRSLNDNPYESLDLIDKRRGNGKK